MIFRYISVLCIPTLFEAYFRLTCKNNAVVLRLDQCVLRIHFHITLNAFSMPKKHAIKHPSSLRVVLVYGHYLKWGSFDNEYHIVQQIGNVSGIGYDIQASSVDQLIYKTMYILSFQKLRNVQSLVMNHTCSNNSVRKGCLLDYIQ